MNTAGLAFGQPVGIPILPSRLIVHGARYARAIAVYTHDALRTYRVCCAHIALHVCAVSLSTLRATMVETQEGLTPFAWTPQGSQLKMRGEERDARSKERNPAQ